jgi:nitroreductase
MLMDIIKSRRSIRAYSDRPVSSEILHVLLEAARWAPTGGNKQPWVFVVIRKQVNLQKVQLFAPGMRGNPTVVLVLCSDTSIEGSTHIMDISMAAQNIMLAATGNGLGSCPIRSFSQRAIKTLLYLPPHVEPELLISLGYPAKPVKAPAKRAIEEIVHWEHYGGHPDE